MLDAVFISDPIFICDNGPVQLDKSQRDNSFVMNRLILLTVKFKSTLTHVNAFGPRSDTEDSNSQAVAVVRAI